VWQKLVGVAQARSRKGVIPYGVLLLRRSSPVLGVQASGGVTNTLMVWSPTWSSLQKALPAATHSQVRKQAVTLAMPEACH
jgi:hypothetical protein